MAFYSICSLSLISFKRYRNTAGCSTAYNWSFKHLMGSDIHKKNNFAPPPPPYTQNWTVKLLFKNRRIHKQKNFKTPLPSSLLCGHHKCNAPYAMTNAYRKWKMVPLLSNFWNQFTVAIIFIFMKQLTFGDHFFLHILVEEYCELLVFLFFILFLISSVYYRCRLFSFNF